MDDKNIINFNQLNCIDNTINSNNLGKTNNLQNINNDTHLHCNMDTLNNNFNKLNVKNKPLNNYLNDLVHNTNINDISQNIKNEKDLDDFLEHLKEIINHNKEIDVMKEDNTNNIMVEDNTNNIMVKDNTNNVMKEDNMNDSNKLDSSFGIPKDLLEIRNRQDTKHFDDEDFIYNRFELPQFILEEVAHSGLDFVDYFHNMLNEFEQNNEFDNFEVYYHVCIIYQYINIYYSLSSEQREEINPQFFPYDFLSIVKTICHDVVCDCCLDYNDSSYTYFHDYTKEVMHGLRLIITQLSTIMRVLECHNYTDLNEYPSKYFTRVIKLINNLCIVMIFIKFYYNQSDFNYETTEEEDAMNDFSGMVPKVWQIKYTSKKVRKEIKNTFQKFNQQNLQQQTNQQNDESTVINGVANMEIN
tara:strand:- start:44 stop:1285 length:1242 start_codon:yes stop_codon:yes gene_type:complete